MTEKIKKSSSKKKPKQISDRHTEEALELMRSGAEPLSHSAMTADTREDDILRLDKLVSQN